MNMSLNQTIQRQTNFNKEKYLGGTINEMLNTGKFKNTNNEFSYDFKFEKIEKKVMKSRPPFPNLSSFVITSIVLSYYEFHGGVKLLLASLSHKTQDYYM